MIHVDVSTRAWRQLRGRVRSFFVEQLGRAGAARHMNDRIKIIVGSIVGAVALHAVLSLFPLRDAHAQSHSCSRWETSVHLEGDGWEPFAAVWNPSGGLTVVNRRCTR